MEYILYFTLQQVASRKIRTKFFRSDFITVVLQYLGTATFNQSK